MFQRLQSLGVYYVQAPPAVPANVHEPGFCEDLEVLRHRLLADVEMLADLPYGARRVPYETKDGLAARLGQRSKNAFTAHRLTVQMRGRKIKP